MSRIMVERLRQRMTECQKAELHWNSGTVPVSVRFNDPYFSLEGGLEEARHVFLDGNDLPKRYRKGFRLAELGFGTGLNMLAAHLSWCQAELPGPLRYTGFEAFPISLDDMERALAAFPEAHEVAGPLLDVWKSGRTRFSTPGLDAEIILGDARKTLPHWPHQADAWFLDGFAPDRNPELWEPALMREVARHTRRDGTIATYSAAGRVRRALDAAGFDVVRSRGFGSKRHMTTGTIRP